MAFSNERAFQYLTDLAAIGRRPPGTPAHETTVAWMVACLGDLGLKAEIQRWNVVCSRAPGGRADLTNLLARIPGRQPGPRTLVGTHWDSRWIADHEPDPSRRGEPIPGVNDGGSGVAVQLELARVLLERPPAHDVILAFFDGEDLGDLDGHRFAVGSRHFVRHAGEWLPDQVIALDMVGGVDAHYTIDMTSLQDPGGKRIFQRLFALGRQRGLGPYFRNRQRYIYSDHGPFLDEGIPAALLIDILYPQWHTQDDTLEHCSAASLGAAGIVVEAFLGGEPA